MKVTIFFCLLAVYGAVAADTDIDVNVNTDAASAAAGKAKSWINKLAPGNLLSSGLNKLDSGLKWKESLVHQGLDMANDATQGGSQAADQVMTGAQEIIKAGAGIGVNVANTMTSMGSQLTGKALGLANTATGGHIEGVLSKLNNTAQSGIALGGSAADFGFNGGASVALAGMDLGKSVVKNVGEKAGQMLGYFGNVETNINNKTSSIGTKIVDKISNAGVSLGQWFSNSFQLNKNKELTE